LPSDLFLYSYENVLRQLESAEYLNGYYVLEFYADDDGRPSRIPASKRSKFYLYPSGGTLRDGNFHLIFYDSRFDTYRGFKPPHLKKNPH